MGHFCLKMLLQQPLQMYGPDLFQVEGYGDFLEGWVATIFASVIFKQKAGLLVGMVPVASAHDCRVHRDRLVLASMAGNTVSYQQSRGQIVSADSPPTDRQL